MNTRSTRPSSASSSGPLTARRIAQPGSFSKLIQRTGCDDKLTSSNSKLTPFQILNPKVDQNIPKISPVQAAQRRNTNASLAEASTTSTTSLNKTLRSDRKRPTSGYIANRQQQLEEEEWEDDPYGTPSPTGNRKCIVELEEELIAKTIQLHKLTLESEQSRKIYRSTKQQMDKKIHKNEVLKQHLVNTIKVVREHMEEVEAAYSKAHSAEG